MDRKLAVLGSPIEHSKSPAIHLAAYRVLGLPWSYQKFEVHEGGLKNFVDSLDQQWLGLSLTMPLKEEAARLAVNLDEFAERTKAVNTIARAPFGWSGFNTDVFGIVQAIRLANLGQLEHVLLIGSGATATSTVVALQQIAPHARLSIFARNKITRDNLVNFARSLGLSARVAAGILPAANRVDLTVSTLPAGSLDEVGRKFAKAFTFRPSGAVFDVAYKPWPSLFAKAWLKNGKPAISGLDMLIWQAVAQIRIFTSGNPSLELPNEVAVVEAMRHAVGE